MAKANINLPIPPQFAASLGDYSMYYRKGKLVVRRKGGPKSEDIKNGSAYAKTRNQMSEFGGSSTAGKMVRDAMSSLNHLTDFNLQSRMTSVIAAIKDLDLEKSQHRSIIFSRGKHLLEGFNLSEGVTFDAIVATPVTFSIDRNERTAVLQLPPLKPGKNFNPTAFGYPYFRFRINLGIIRDMEYVDKIGYKKLLYDPSDYTEMLDTEWYRTKSPLIGQEVGLTLVDLQLDESCHLMLSIGIEFGTPSGMDIKPVKGAGAAKILGVV